MTFAAIFRSAESDRRRHADLRSSPSCSPPTGGLAGRHRRVSRRTPRLGGVRSDRRPCPDSLEAPYRCGDALVGAGVGMAATARIAAVHSGPLPHLAAAHTSATVEAVVTDDPHTITTKRGPLVIIPARAERVTHRRRRLPGPRSITVMASDPEAWRACCRRPGSASPADSARPATAGRTPRSCPPGVRRRSSPGRA